MNVFVAGASGVIGRPVVRQLVERGHRVVGMTRDARRADALERLGATPVVCDVYDEEGLRAAVRGAEPEVVVHQLTALPAAIDPRRIESQLADNDRIRVVGTRNLVRAAEQAGAGRVVAQSVAFAYEPAGDAIKTERDPLWTDAPPAFQRTVSAILDLERQVGSMDGVDGVVLRYGYFYGPGTAYAPDGSIAEMVRKRQFPIAGGGSGIFSFIHVEDAAAATVAAVEGDAVGIYNIVDDAPVALRDWLPAYAEAIGAPPPRRVPGFLARLLAGTYGHTMMIRQRGASNASAKQALGWSPSLPTFQEGLA